MRPSTEEQAAASEGGCRLRQSLRQSLRSETGPSEWSSSGSLATTDALPLPTPTHRTNSSLESLSLGTRPRKIGLQPRTCWGCWGNSRQSERQWGLELVIAGCTPIHTPLTKPLKPLTHLSTPPQMLRDVLIQNAAHHFEHRISSR